MINNNISVEDGSGTRATSRGTKITKPGSDMDKNAFLRILMAELTNQDPMNAKDSTEYVAQMAQFSSMEQMANLNATMTSNSANSLIGKGVILNVNDGNGNAYSGIVRDVTNNAGTIKLGVEVTVDGKKEIMDFDSSAVVDVYDNPNYSMDYMSANTALLAAASFIGKRVEVNQTNSSGENIVGMVKGIVRDGSDLKLRVEPDDGSDSILVSLDSVNKLDMA